MASAAHPTQDTLPETATSQAGHWRHARNASWPLMALSVLLILQFTLIFTRAINWDEYSYFRQVAWFADGRLDRPLQTIHVHFFAWLPGLFETSTDHIVLARTFMFGCELVTLGSIVATAQRFGDRRTAVLVALAYLSAAFVLQHGTSFRVDPILTALLCSALAVLANARLGWASIAGFGLLAGLAGMVSVKAVLYLPAFAGLALWRWNQAGWSRAFLVRLTFAGIAALAAFGLFYLYHAQDVSAEIGASGGAQELVSTAGHWAFFLGAPPYAMMAIKAIFTAPIFAAMIFALPLFLWRSKLQRTEKIALIGLWLPIVSIFFYTNTAAYFYVFILPPVAIACVPVMDWAIRRYPPRMMVLVLMAMGAAIWLLEDRDTIDRQRQLEENVRQVFTEPVPYFDHNYMMGGWPKMNNFLTPWGIDAYHREGRPAYREAMEKQAIPLFLANYPLLDETISGERDDIFFDRDLAALRNNYIEHSWPIWVAGKDYSGRDGSFADEFLVPGIYTVEGGAISIDGKTYYEGDLVDIAGGEHLIDIVDGPPIKLVWGDRLPLPSMPLERGNLYVGF